MDISGIVLKALEKVETPALVICIMVIGFLFVWIWKKENSYEKISVELQENGKVMAKMAAILDLICNKIIGGRK